MNADTPTLCFFVDEGAEHRLPRMRHDDRRAWFCFENQEVARTALEPHLGQSVALRIADYRTVYEFTDAVDTATLLAVE